MKKIISLLLAVIMVASLLPMTVFATGKTLPYSFDFETDPFENGWTTIDNDGDDYEWETDTDFGWGNKLGIDEGNCAMSMSYSNDTGRRSADNWLFSPAITIPGGGAIVSWYEQSQDSSYPDSYEVYICGTNTEIDLSKMTKIFSGTAANPWTQRSVELKAAEYAGKTVYIAFRHLSYDCFYLEIDDFAVEALPGGFITDGTAQDANGTISIDKEAAAEGETVTVTVNPAEGYKLKSLKYNDGSDHDITKDETSGNYQFTMPAANVTVTAEFELIEEEPEEPVRRHKNTTTITIGGNKEETKAEEVKEEENPDTGAPVMNLGAVAVVLGAAYVISKKH